MPDPKPAPPRRRRLILALAGVGLVLLAGLLWLNRRNLAREAMTGWLKSKGVAARADVQAFGPTTFTARLTLGDPKNPDFAAERAEVHYHMSLAGLQVDSVTLKKPVLHATLRQGRLAAGSLDPLIREFLARPPRPDATKPRIRVEGGVLLLATDYGPIRLTADAIVNDGKLQSLSAVSAPARLRGPGFDVNMGEGALSEKTVGARVTASFAAPFRSVSAGGLSARDGGVSLKIEAPQPDLAKLRSDGAVAVAAQLAGAEVAFQGRRFARAKVDAGFVGQARGWISDLAAAGRMTGNLEATGGDLAGAGVGRLRAALATDDVAWTRAGGDRLAARLRVTALADDIAAGGLRVSSATATAAGPLAASREGVDLAMTGSALGRGLWNGLGAPAVDDSPQVAAVKRAARGFRFAAPGLRAQLRGGVFSAALDQPLSLRPDTGGEARLTAAGDGYRVTAAGGGLPQIDATVRRVVFGAETAADLTLKARGGFLFAEGAEIDTAGRVRIAGGGLSFTAQRCAAFSVAHLEFGANDVEQVAGRLCPTVGPLLTMAGADWRIAGRAEGVSAAAPFLQARATEAGGPLTAASRGGRMTATAEITTGRFEDTSPQARFNPLAASGHVTLADYVWTADLAVRQPRGAPVGRAHVVHDSGLGVGFVTLESGDLVFAEGGLQPAELSPMASAVGAPATGVARFDGRFDWAKVGAGSRGTLSLKGLSFQSPVGRVEGLSGELAFTSLAPLTAAPGQSLQVETVQAIVPLTHLNARFSLADNLLKIEGGEAVVGGGRIRIESLETPLAPGAPTRGVLIFEGVQLHDLVEASPFGDKVDLDAKVSGRVAFEALDNKVRISAGELKAIQPGRLSIDHSALTGVTADSAIAAPVAAPVDDPNATFTDFAYQAMEHLAFDTLEATVASRDDGRLGVVFHIVGRHDPPTKQKIRLSVMDLIQKRFLGRKLPLPSGTGVNLTLDTTLNLDDLLSDYADFRRLHGSGEVQP